MSVLKSAKSRKIALLIIILLIVGAVAVVWKKHNDDQRAKVGENGAVIEAEKKSNEDFNKKLQEDNNGSNNSSSDTSSNLQAANVILVGASTTETRGYISNILEENGTCTATYVKGSEKVTGTSKGIVDVNKTTCPPISIKGLSAGKWTVVLSYKSSTSSGSSEAATVSVP